MKTAALCFFANVLLMSSPCFSQDKNATAKTDDLRPAAKVLLVLGRVSDDGKALVTDLDSEWKVANTELLKGLEGRLVRVRCYVDTAKSQIQVVSIKRDSGESNYAARYGDSAFRR